MSYPPMVAPTPTQYGGTNSIDHFQNYRNETISRMTFRRNEDFGHLNMSYTPSVDVSVYKKFNKYLDLPPSHFSMIDRARQQEVNDVYLACQYHRDQYKDHTGSLHPMDYFKRSEYMYQCPTDPTSRYLKCPETYVKYKQPIVLPLTLERSLQTPQLPDRALTGIYDKSSDICYKK